MGVSPIVHMNFSTGGASPYLAERDAVLIIPNHTDMVSVVSFQIAAEYKT
jgi:hypothetical protein